ncbi:MAG: calcium/sodium antiporter [Lentisphaeria bacterium]|nr:calcium/sodium antiporter [Lentisphaeria bacterium]
MTEFLLHLLYAVLGIAGLYYGAEFLVKGGVSIARRAGVSPLVIGLTLVAFATSAPELVVSVSAAIDGSSDISLGNVVGSNICNIALILGLCACITPMVVQRQILRFDSHFMVGSAVLLAVFYLSGNGVNRIQALVLLAGMIVYVVWNVYASRKENAAAETEKTEEKLLPLWQSLLLIVLALALLVAGAKIFLRSAVFFAGKLGLSEAVIGLTIVAVGTSLPELATSVVAAIKGEDDIAIGNVVGSNIFNILCILGITPLIAPLKNAALDPVDMGAMILVSILLVPMMRTGWKISRKEGAALLILYAGYITYLLCTHT